MRSRSLEAREDAAGILLARPPRQYCSLQVLHGDRLQSAGMGDTSGVWGGVQWWFCAVHSWSPQHLTTPFFTGYLQHAVL